MFQEDRARLFLVVPSYRTRGNIGSTWHTGSSVRVWRKPLMSWQHWNRLPREVVESPSLEIFKTCLDVILDTYSRWTCWRESGWLCDLQRPLPTPTILWLCESIEMKKKRRSFQGFLAQSDKNMISLWQDQFPPVSMSLLRQTLLSDRPIGSLWYVDLHPASNVPFCPLLFIYPSSNPVSFLLKYHFPKRETDKIIYRKFCTFVILVVSLSNHL